MRLTDLSVKALAPPERGQKTYWDASLPGFGCRVSQGGTRSFVVMHGRSRQLTTIGRYPVISLGDARQRAKEILAERVLGKTRVHSNISFEEAVAKFLDIHEVRERTKAEYARILRRHFLPKLRREPLERIHTTDLTRIIDRLASTPSEARHVYATASVFFNWALSRRLIEQNPLAGVRAPKTSASRDRVLTDDELAIVLSKATVNASTIGAIVRLLIFTGQRRGEIAGLRWSYIDPDERTITWPGEAVKNGRRHIIPYGMSVAALFDTVPKSTSLLFPARDHDDRPFSGWSKTGVLFSRSCGIEPWTLHDLRRTFASGMQRLGVRVEVPKSYSTTCPAHSAASSPSISGTTIFRKCARRWSAGSVILPLYSKVCSFVLPALPRWLRSWRTHSRESAMEGFYTIKDVCKLLHVARETLRRWERDGWFPKRVRFSRHARAASATSSRR